MTIKQLLKGYLNLQNRTDLLTVEEVTPNQWMTFSLDLQPTIYKLRLVLYNSDFESHRLR
ncbi:hypothetical protein C4K46_07320 [Streptococcus oricebi]|uniref:Xaa-Pro dipeptidyl-peptidase C-terminal domain-containing protein n=1 Tax=Streptococcus oricebi TaxID=1547447 RepID=A0ABS5B6W8_9STRE|nr:hypothetical protein [Streptococcus oricebi]